MLLVKKLHIVSYFKALISDYKPMKRHLPSEYFFIKFDITKDKLQCAKGDAPFCLLMHAREYQTPVLNWTFCK